MILRLLRRKLGWIDFELVTFRTNDIPPYAILSRAWTGYEEVTYEDLVTGRGKIKAGYAKISSCGERADMDRVQYLWVDTCCIDKSSSAELSESLNSMYSWDQEAQVCYAYLDDWQSDSDWVDLVSLEQEEESIDEVEDEDHESQKQVSEEGDETSPARIAGVTSKAISAGTQLTKGGRVRMGRSLGGFHWLPGRIVPIDFQ